MNIVNVGPIWFHKGEGISEVIKSHHFSFANAGFNSRLVQTNYNEAVKLPINNASLYDAVSGCAITPKTLFGLFRVLGNYDGSVYFVHGIFQLRILLTIIFLFLRRQRYIVIPHSSLSAKAFSGNSRLKRFLYTSLIVHLIRKSEFVMFLNEEEKERGIYNEKNIEVFPNGVNKRLNIHLGDDRAKSGVVRMIYLGRFDIKHKGIDYLLEFLKNLKYSKPNFKWKLDMYGSDSKGGLAFINGYIYKNGLSDFVSVHDAVFGDDKDRALSSADLFMLTSRYEGMPVAVLEALRNGLPCFLSKETNMLTTLKEAGVAEEFIHDDFHRSFESLCRVSDKDFRIVIQKRCMELVEREYSWDAICARIGERLRMCRS